MERNDKIFSAIVKDPAVRRKLGYESHFMFFNIYFPHYLKYGMADFHKEILEITEDDSNKLACIVAFRGSGKSTLVTFSYAIWATLGVQQKKFVVISCQTQAQAKQHMANLKYELENNLVLKSDMGPFQEEKFNGEWAMSSLVFRNTGARIMISSVDQSIRGVRHKQYRPDLIILDDIEDMNSVKTFEGREKISNWFSREIVPLGDLGTRIIIVGNLLHEDSLMMQLKRRVERKEINAIYKWFPLVDDGGKCLWPQKFDTDQKIEELRQSITSDVSWYMEYLLQIVSDDSRVIDPNWITYYDEIPEKNEENEYRGAFVGIDLAISEAERADCTAMVVAHVFGWGDKMKVYIEANPVNKRMDFLTSVETTRLTSKSFSYRERNAEVYAENNGYQESFIQIVLMDRSIRIEGIRSKGDKRTRLAFVSTLIKNGRALFPKKGAEQLLSQLTGFGLERHDDLCDAFSLVVGEIIKRNKGRSALPDYDGGGDTICGDLMDTRF